VAGTKTEKTNYKLRTRHGVVFSTMVTCDP